MSDGIGVYLERVLDEVAPEIAGAPALRLARELLVLCIVAGDAIDHPARDEAADRLHSVDVATLAQVIELITARFHLMNMGEQLSIARINHDRELAATREAPRRESIAEAIALARRAGVSASQLATAIIDVEVGPTLTAHPTEARRRTVITKQLEIADFARRLHTQPLTAVEQHALHRRIHASVSLLLASDGVRARRLTVDDEARNGLFFLTHSIWQTVPRLIRDVRTAVQSIYPEEADAALPDDLSSLITYRSWIGGDRDGNPEVTHAVTKATLNLHRDAARQLWDAELEKLEQDLSISTRRLDVLPELAEAVERDREQWLLDPNTAAHRGAEPFRLRILQMRARLRHDRTYSSRLLTADLKLLQRALVDTHVPWLAAYSPLEDAIVRARVFGLQLATLDIRQHSSVHEHAVSELLAFAGVTDRYASMSEPERLEILRHELATRRPLAPSDAVFSPVTAETLRTLDVIRDAITAEPATIRSYVISMTHGVSDVLEVLLMMKERGLMQAPSATASDLVRTLHVVPLLETIDDLERGPDLLSALLADPVYRRHLDHVSHQDATTGDSCAPVQEVMLGYSDSNKDGGFFMANVALHAAQERLALAGRSAGVNIRFFHGRGGTVGRGGGRAGRAILAAPPAARTGRLRFTEQGEVISFRYALPEIAHRHLEQILNAAIRAALPLKDPPTTNAPGRPPFDALLSRLADISMRRYRDFIGDPRFWKWFTSASPIAHIGSLPIASRPVARGSGDAGFAFDQLRAIPWVFSWIQMRALAPGWFGIGAALAACTPAEFDLLRDHLEDSSFLSTILDNAAQEMARARLPIARRYAALGPVPADNNAMYRMLEEEFSIAHDRLLALTSRTSLLEHSPVIAASIAVRNPWTDVLNLIQIELLTRVGAAAETDRPPLRSAILASINGIAAAMQSTG